MTHEQPTYPAIRDFVRGYLHQDAAAEYGSAPEAMRQFCRDSESADREKLRSEWQRLLAAHPDLAHINNELQKLGCAWLFRTREELDEMLAGCKEQK